MADRLEELVRNERVLDGRSTEPSGVSNNLTSSRRLHKLVKTWLRVVVMKVAMLEEVYIGSF